MLIPFNQPEIYVIKVTLEFNTQAELLAFFAKDTVAPAKVEAPKSVKPAATPAAQPTTTATPKASAKAEPATESPSEGKPAAAATPAAQPASTQKPSDSVDYPTLQKAVFALANASREAAGEVAAGFGVKTFKELDSSKWGEALAAVNAKLESLQVA